MLLDLAKVTLSISGCGILMRNPRSRTGRRADSLQDACGEVASVR
jgi:hypothetical protein